LPGRGFFGFNHGELAAFFFLQGGRGPWLAVAGAYLLHMGWNVLIYWLINFGVVWVGNDW